MKIRLAVAFCLLASVATAAPKKGATVEGITEYTLDNGLRVLLFPDDSTPTITVNVTYLVGSRHEGYGETGMAHLLEHMTYKGSRRHPKMIAELESHGARLNGTTDTDRTNYFETVKATPENLRWAIDLEADRMVRATISAADLATEFSVVRNEFELGESSPENILIERLFQSAYLWHNYGKPTIGSRADIERVPAESLRAFYTRYYQPDNAVLVVAGKFDPKRALSEIQAKFGAIPRPKRKLAPTYTIEPVQDGERAVTLERTGDVQIAAVLYHGVGGADPDAPAEQALLDLLTRQPSGRLYKALVETGMAARVEEMGTLWHDPGAFLIYAEVRADKPLMPVRDRLIELTEGMAKANITDEEIERYKTRALREIELELTDPERFGVTLSEWLAGDWRMKFLYRDRIKALTAAQVKAFAGKFLKSSNRTVGLFKPTKTPERAPLVATPDVGPMVAAYKGQPALAAGEVFEASIENIDKRTERTTLPNGMKLALLPKRTRGGKVELILTIRAGAEADLRGKTSVAQLLRDAVLRGTKKRSYQQITDLLDKLRAEIKQGEDTASGSSVGGAAYHIATVRQSVPEVLALLAEIVREPALAKDQIEVLRRERLAELEGMLQQPVSAGMSALLQRLNPWPKDDPRYVPSIAEQIERLRAITAEQLAQLHAQLWGGAAASLVMVGDFDPLEVKTIAQKELDAWKAQKPWSRITRPYRATIACDETLPLPDKAAAFAGTAMAIQMKDDDPDFPAFDLANFVYGGGEKSRIWERLREKEGLSYSVFSFADADAFEPSGFLFAGAFCAPQNAKKAMNGLVEELRKILDHPVSEAELREAKKTYQAQFDNSLTVDAELVARIEKLLDADRTLAFYKKHNDAVQAVSAAQLTAVLKKHVKTDGLARIKAGDLK